VTSPRVPHAFSSCRPLRASVRAGSLRQGLVNVRVLAGVERKALEAPHVL
jgi:hypothetical protein